MSCNGPVLGITVHDTDLPVVSKFTYLMSLLEGDPKQAIHGLYLTADHYAIACKILKDRFAQKETIIFTHIQKSFRTIQVHCLS